MFLPCLLPLSELHDQQSIRLFILLAVYLNVYVLTFLMPVNVIASSSTTASAQAPKTPSLGQSKRKGMRSCGARLPMQKLNRSVGFIYIYISLDRPRPQGAQQREKFNPTARATLASAYSLGSE